MKQVARFFSSHSTDVGVPHATLQELFGSAAVDRVFDRELSLQPYKRFAEDASLSDLESWLSDVPTFRRILRDLTETQTTAAAPRADGRAKNPPSFEPLVDAIVQMQLSILSQNRVPIPPDPASLGARAPWLLTQSGTLTSHELPEGADALLRDCGITSWEALAAATEEALIQARGADERRVVRDLVRDLAERPLAIDDARHLPVHVGLADAARYAQTVMGQETLADLISHHDQLPPAEQEQVQALLDVPLRRIAPAPSVSGLLAELLTHARNPKLFAQRVLAETPPTLEELGQEYDVTRERIRQLIAKDLETLLLALGMPEFAPLCGYLDRLRSMVESPRRIDDPALVDLIHLAKNPAWPTVGARRFVTLLAHIEERDGWIGLGKSAIEAAHRRFATALRAIDVVDDDFATLAAANGVDPHALREAAEVARLGRWIGPGCFVRWGGSAASKAHMVLRLALQPLTAEEIASHCDDGTGARNLANQLSADERFMRVDKMNRYALVEWGMEEYSGIVEEIRQRIERGRGQASKAAIIHEFTNAFGVSESSIHSYLSGPLFVVEGDSVSLAASPEEAFVPKHPGRFGGVVSTPHGWGQRVVVTAEHLRGYSFVCNFHVAYANGCRPGDTLRVPITVDEMPTATGGSLIWRFTSPGIDVGRCREAIASSNVKEGESITIVPTSAGIWIISHEDATLDAVPTPDSGDDAVVDDAILSFFS